MCLSYDCPPSASGVSGARLSGWPSMVLGIFALVFLVFIVAAFRANAFVWAILLIGPFPFGTLLREPNAATPFGSIHINALVVFAILVASIVAIIVGGRGAATMLRASWLFAAFLAFASLSLLWTPDHGMALRMLLKLATPYAFMLAVATSVVRAGAGPLFDAAIASGILYASMSVAAYALGWVDDAYLGLPGTSRAVSSGHLLAPYAALLSQSCEQPGLWRIVATAALALGVVGGFTRNTIGGLFAATGAILFVRGRALFRIIVPAVGFVSFIALFTFVDAFRERMFLQYADSVSFDSVLKDPGSALDAISGSGRFQAWQVALDLLHAPSPVIGSGVGASQALFYDTPTGPSAVHSEIIRLLCDLGWIGLSLFVLAWTQLLWGVLRRRRDEQDPASSATSLAAIGSATAYLVFLLTDNGIDYVAQMGVFVYAFVGAAIALTPSVQRAELPRRRLLFGATVERPPVFDPLFVPRGLIKKR
jgi:hypothetical protein